MPIAFAPDSLMGGKIYTVNFMNVMTMYDAGTTFNKNRTRRSRLIVEQALKTKNKKIDKPNEKWLSYKT